MGNTQTGNIIIRNEYWYIGQFSKFIRPGAKRVAASSNRSALQTTAFINSDGKIAVIVLNRSDNNLRYHIWSNGVWMGHAVTAHSIQTIIIE
jgi:glucosylceramidase